MKKKPHSIADTLWAWIVVTTALCAFLSFYRLVYWCAIWHDYPLPSGTVYMPFDFMPDPVLYQDGTAFEKWRPWRTVDRETKFH